MSWIIRFKISWPPSPASPKMTSDLVALRLDRRARLVFGTDVMPSVPRHAASCRPGTDRYLPGSCSRAVAAGVVHRSRCDNAHRSDPAEVLVPWPLSWKGIRHVDLAPSCAARHDHACLWHGSSRPRRRTIAGIGRRRDADLGFRHLLRSLHGRPVPPGLLHDRGRRRRGGRWALGLRLQRQRRLAAARRLRQRYPRALQLHEGHRGHA